MLYWKRKSIQNILKGCLLFCKKLNSVLQSMNPSPLYLLFPSVCDEAFIRYYTAKITRELTTSGKLSYCLTISKFVVHSYLQYTRLEAQNHIFFPRGFISTLFFIIDFSSPFSYNDNQQNCISLRFLSKNLI